MAVAGSIALNRSVSNPQINSVWVLAGSARVKSAWKTTLTIIITSAIFDLIAIVSTGVFGSAATDFADDEVLTQSSIVAGVHAAVHAHASLQQASLALGIPLGAALDAALLLAVLHLVHCAARDLQEIYLKRRR